MCSGAVPAAAFPEANLWWAAPLGLAVVTMVVVSATHPREAVARAWLAGCGYFIAAAHWMIPNVGPGLLVFAALLGLSWIPWGWIAAHTLRMPASPARTLVAVAGVPAAFVVGEYIRSWENLGGPWALVGASQWATRRIVGLAALGGVWLLSFFIVAVAVSLCVALLSKTTAPLRIGTLLAGAAIVLIGNLLAGQAPGFEGTDSVTIAGVQPGPDLGAEDRLEVALSATEELGPSDLVVWGESSVGFDLRVREVLTRIEKASAAASAPVLANFDARAGSGGIYKSSILISAAGVAERYDKLRLVPFGEYIPLRPLLGWVGSISEAADEDRRRGETPVLIDVGNFRVGPLICFESTFPDMTRRLAQMGADVIVVQSATSSFQESWAPEQHASLAAIRAVESGRTVIQATLTGVSAAFDPEGRELLWVPTNRRGTYLVEAPISTAITPYVRMGDWLPVACFGAVILWMLVTALKARTNVQNSTTVSPTDTPSRAVDPRTSIES